MQARASQVTTAESLYPIAGHGGLGFGSGFRALLGWLEDLADPSRVCARRGSHVPGPAAHSYEAWDLDHQYPGAYVGRHCAHCGMLVR